MSCSNLYLVGWHHPLSIELTDCGGLRGLLWLVTTLPASLYGGLYRDPTMCGFFKLVHGNEAATYLVKVWMSISTLSISDQAMIATPP